MFCSDGIFIGANFRSEENQGLWDDTAGNNLALRCSNGQDILTEVPGSRQGSRDGLANCPDGINEEGVYVIYNNPICQLLLMPESSD